MKPLVIIGTGLAGYTLAKSFRQMDTDTPLIMITEDDGAFYSKPLLSNAFDKNKTPDAIVTATAEVMAEQLNATIHTHCSVKTIDVDTHCIKTDSDTIEYGKLVLATGADLITPNITGDTNALWRVNNLMQYREFYNALQNKEELAIIGSGFIGCEFANDCITAGKSVTVISADSYPMQRILPKEIGVALEKKLTDAGVRFLWNTLVTHVDASQDTMSLSLHNNDSLQADLTLAAIGIQPRLDLAAKAGLKTNRGILINETLATSAADIYALGDGVEFNDSVRAYIAPLLLQAKTLAKHLANAENKQDLVYPALPVTLKTPIFPIACVVPHAEGRWEISSNDTGIQGLCFNEKNELIGFALTEDRCKERMALIKDVVV